MILQGGMKKEDLIVEQGKVKLIQTFADLLKSSIANVPEIIIMQIVVGEMQSFPKVILMILLPKFTSLGPNMLDF